MVLRKHEIWSPRTLLAALLVLVCTMAVAPALTVAHAQNERLSVSIDGFSPQEWPQAQSILTVLDANGKPVEGLTQDGVQAFLNDTAAPVTSVSRGVDSNLPSFVVLGLDASANVAGAPLDQQKVAAHQFIDSLGPQDSVAILAYSDTPNLVQPFTQDRGAAHAAVDAIAAGGGSALYNAATQSVLLAAASVQTGRRAVVLVTSAADSTQDDPNQSLVAAQGLGVPIFAVGVGPAADAAYLQQLTEAAGGRFVPADTPDGVVAVLHDVSELLRNQYVVAVDASGLDIDPTHLASLRFEVTAAGASGTAERVVCPGSVCAVFKGLEAGARLETSQQVVADVVSSERIESVSLLVDGEAVQTLEESPYEFSVDPEDFASGDHTLALEVTTTSGSQQLGEVTVQLGTPASGGGGSNLPLFAIAGLVAVALLVAVFIILRRRGHKGGGDPAPTTPSPEPPEPISVFIAKQRARPALKEDAPPPVPPMDLEPTLGYLNMTDGPLAGQVFAVGAKPLSIGSGHRCHIQLPLELDGYEVPSEYARVWIRGDQLMVHEIKRLTAMGAVGGQWEFLSVNDTFAIGPCVFRFVLEEPAQPSNEPVPNVLRDRPENLETGALDGQAAGPSSSPEALPADAYSAASGSSSPVPITTALEQASPPEELPNIFRDKPPSAEHPDDPPMEQAAGG